MRWFVSPAPILGARTPASPASRRGFATRTISTVLVAEWTQNLDPYECMERLQAAGVPAGVCQTAEDRCDRDPQLQALEWLTEVDGTKIGRWPVAEAPFKLSRTPAHVGGLINRGAACYAEDNEYVLGELLGHSTSDIRGLEAEGVI